MAIVSRDGLVTAMAGGQFINYNKQVARTTVATGWFSLFDLAGSPGAGVLAGTSTTAGVVPDATTAGCPTINAYGGSNTGYLANVDYGNTVQCRFRICDMVFKAGAYAFNAATGAMAAQPSYAARIPNADYTGTQIWIECVTAFTGNLTIAVTYTNQAGVTAHTTGTIATGVAPTVGRLIQLPLQTGDTGVQKIESVTSTVATVGTFNVLVLRRLTSLRVKNLNDGGNKGPDQLGLVVVPALAAIYIMCNTDSTSTGVPELEFQIING